MGARVYQGPFRSLSVDPIQNDPVYRGFLGWIGPTPRLPEPINSGCSLRGDCVCWTSWVYKAMLPL